METNPDLNKKHGATIPCRREIKESPVITLAFCLNVCSNCGAGSGISNKHIGLAELKRQRCSLEEAEASGSCGVEFW